MTTATLQAKPWTTLFEKMKAIVEAPGFSGLLHYKQDFYTYDKQYLESAWYPGAQVIWVVTENGTHMAFTGVHQKSVEAAKAAIGNYNKELLYSVTSEGVKPISVAEAHRICEKVRLSTRNGSIYYDNNRIGRIEVQIERHQSVLLSTVTMHTVEEFAGWSEKTLEGAFSMLAVYESIEQAQSLFVGVKTATLNGKVIFSNVG